MPKKSFRKLTGYEYGNQKKNKSDEMMLQSSCSYYDDDDKALMMDELMMDELMMDEFIIFEESVKKELEDEKDKAIKYHMNLTYQVPTSKSDSVRFYDHIHTVCSKPLKIPYYQEAYNNENTHLYKTVYLNNNKYDTNEYLGKQIFRKVITLEGYTCNTCCAQSSYYTQPELTPKLTWLPEYRGNMHFLGKEFENLDLSNGLIVNVEYSNEYDSPIRLRKFFTTRTPEDWMSSEECCPCPCCSYDPYYNWSVHFDYCSDCFHESFPLPIAKMKLFYHTLLKQFNICCDLEKQIVILLL